MTAQLPIKPESGGRMAEGFCTPKEDCQPQKMSVAPKRVIPIVFLPGIMGSNLRMSSTRQSIVRSKNNIAWRPDWTGEALALVNASPAARQLQLDPMSTEVDTYVGPAGITGNSKETAEQRHKVDKLTVHFRLEGDTPLLMDDPSTKSPRRTKEEKARDRGWGEIYFSSYQKILEQCEMYLNKIKIAGLWDSVINIDPALWQASDRSGLAQIGESELKKALSGCWYPVHAMGYNWLKSSSAAAVDIRSRLEKMMEKYVFDGYECEKIVLVTHSMGGLVARALMHPEIGNFSDKILGVVHGVMPASGAPAAYKRMRCGFEEAMAGLAVAPKVLGNFGTEVTAVLANSPGGLELLPSKEYGNGWLQIRHKGVILKRLPEKGDPYEEIYKLRGKWYGLLREEWINPANDDAAGFERTCNFLNRARKFHEAIASTYHEQSYAHYGADASRPSWESVIWDIDKKHSGAAWESFDIWSDSAQGKMIVGSAARPFEVELGESSGAGDQTVPLRSADHQLRSGKFKGIFRQTGYEHQSSYKDTRALRSTLFSLVRIIQKMKWGSCD